MKKAILICSSIMVIVASSLFYACTKDKNGMSPETSQVKKAVTPKDGPDEISLARLENNEPKLLVDETKLKNALANFFAIRTIENFKIYKNEYKLTVMIFSGPKASGSGYLTVGFPLSLDNTGVLRQNGGCTQTCESGDCCSGCTLSMTGDCSGSCYCNTTSCISMGNCKYTVASSGGGSGGSARLVHFLKNALTQ